MKLAAYHKARGDEVTFVRGSSLDASGCYWDRIYVTSLFTYDWKKVLQTIHFYRDNLFGGSTGKVIVGGIAATLLSSWLYNETGINPIRGPLLSARQLGEAHDTAIDELIPDYSILGQTSHAYRYGSAFLARATRGCIRRCPFCAVGSLEPEGCDYIDIKPVVEGIRAQIGDQRQLLLLDNNVLASPRLPAIVDDLIALGFARGAKLAGGKREVDFNQGLDARLITPATADLLSRLPLSPVRVAYDQSRDAEVFERAVELIAQTGFKNISNYLLYNFEDTPEDLWQRMHHCVELGERLDVRLWSFPMRYVPIADTVRGYVGPFWNRRLLRGIQCVSLVTRGTISARHDFFHEAFGDSPDEFLEILSMPDRYIIQRASHRDNGAAEWRAIYRSLEDDERALLWRLTSVNGRRELACAQNEAPPGKLRELLGHYLES